jgi:hypothetical protein
MTDKTSGPLRFIFTILVIALLATGALLLKQRSNLSKIEQEKRDLEAKIESLLSPEALSEITAPTTETPELSSPVEPQPLIPAISTPDVILTFDRASVISTNGILRATLTFKTDSTNALGELFVVARLPDDSGNRIHEILLTPSDTYKNFYKRISDDGKFSAFRTQSGNIREVEMAFEVTGPSTLDVRGTCGIGPFDLNITPELAEITPKK